MDWTVLSFTLGVALVTGILVGLVPALQATKPELAPTLKDEGAGGQGTRALAMGRLLVMGQMAMSVVLLVVAGLFLRSFQASRLLDPGFGSQPTAILTFMVPSQEFPSEEGRQLISEILEETRGLPGVTQAAAISNIHLNPLNSMFLDVNVEGVPAPEGREAHIVDFTSVSQGLFSTAGMQILQGRDFLSTDQADGQPVAIVNQAMAERFWPGRSPLGQTLKVELPGWEDRTVVGVVSTAKIHSLGEAPTPFIYLPYSQEYNALVSVMAVSSDPQGTAGELFRRVREAHPSLIISGSTTLEDHVGVMLIFSRLTALLSLVFAGMALGLSVIGLYGVVSYAVARRGKEMGIRLSLGATPGSVVILQLREGIRVVLVGGILGLFLAAAVSQGLSGLLVGVTSFDPVTYGGAFMTLLAVASLAAFIPARRASRVNPVRALKSE
jgi:predicted permease